ncbi:hypothetical protein [Bifidobacterium cuniculi]|uniref:Uncharacterized protein n=1 Tax=Bifidobacterium cuniculi TaxID=1688 RepID=A0A087AFG2_9BIFI|nr:hypothetical protein [Bifidobacterium cuniculi]KFI57512.1 hypothetical protein BCUN_1860 [Bifidobacterium cuniculi]
MSYADGWNIFLYDTMTGLLAQQIDVPSFTWSMSVSDASFSTSKDKGFGEDEIGGIELPWAQIPGVDAAARASALMPYKRGIVLFWHSAADDLNLPGRPILAGALGVRTSSRDDVSMPFVSMLGLLESRFLVHEGGFGSGPNNSSKGEYKWSNLSWRAVACEVIRECTEAKPGGALPIDLPYLNEKGSHQLPEVSGDDPDQVDSSEKVTKKVTKPNGWTETVTEGGKVTVTDHTETVTSKTVKVNEKYTVWSNGKRVEKTRQVNKTITTGKTVVEVKTVTEEKGYVVEKTVTKTTTTYTYDSNGKQTGSSKKTDGPAKTTEQKTTDVIYRDFNVTNHAAADILKTIANSSGGPDMQFRPYLTEDGQHVRFRFVAGSDGDQYLYQDRRLSLASTPAEGATLENMTVDRAAPIERVYAVGAGTGSGTLCYLAQDLSLVNRADGWPLVEATLSDSKAEEIGSLKSLAVASLNANNRPLMQIKGEVNAFDHDASGLPLHPFGSFWPGEMFDLHVDGFPDLPDGTYPVRLMQMSGDETGKATLVFDIMEDPVV